MKIRKAIFYVSNISKAKEFYKSLGFSIFKEEDVFISFKTDVENCEFAVMLASDDSKIPGKQVCMFSVNNIEDLYSKIKALNYNIVKELNTIQSGYSFSIRDEDGNKIEFVEES